MSLRPDEPSEELDAALRELLAEEVDASETMDPAQKERVRRRLASTLGLPPNGGPGGGSTVSQASSSTGTGAAGKLALVTLSLAAAVTLRVLTTQSPPADDDTRGGGAEIVAVEDRVQAAVEAATPSAAPPTAAVDEFRTPSSGSLRHRRVFRRGLRIRWPNRREGSPKRGRSSPPRAVRS